MEKLIKGGAELGIEISPDKVEKYRRYLELLIEKNSITNLTAIREEDEIIEKHFIDSIAVTKLIPASVKNAIDIGTGAGFPGLALAIMMPEIKFTLMDSIEKKTEFLRDTANEIGLKNVEVVTSRAEDYIKKGKRESYDLGLCRGVAELRVILEYVIPFLKVGGLFLSQKLNGEEEAKEAGKALEILNCNVLHIEKFNLPYCKDKREVVIIEKKGHNDEKYPRKAGIAKKRPL